MDRINIWHRANEARRLKFIVQDDDERHVLNTKEILLRKQNKQIWDELEYWAKTNQILGKYKTFDYQNFLTEYAHFEPAKQITMLTNIQNYRNKANQKLKKTTDPDHIARILGRLEKYDTQEKALKTLLKISSV